MNRGQKFGENEQKDDFNHRHLPLNKESSPHWAYDRGLFVALPPYQSTPDFAYVARAPLAPSLGSQGPRGPAGSGALIVQGKLARQWIGPFYFFFSFVLFLNQRENILQH